MAYLETEVEGQTPVADLNPPRSESPKKPKVYGRTRLVRWREGLSLARQNIVVTLALSVILFPLISFAALTPDLPVVWFDGWARSPSVLPSQWATVADAWFLIAMFAMIMMTRRYGAELVVQAQAVAWLGLVFASFSMIVFLAPQLSASDMPSGKYVMAMAVSWFLAPHVTVHVYDLLRGRAWWRGPLYAGMIGVGIQTTLFFLIAYAGASVPWRAWWVSDFLMKVVAVLMFLATYAVLRRRVRPLPNLGGD